ncbi:hypothetical protein [Egicoccus sp. AB-alg6-2]|uniref:hypothetical protein n=1 Tax=Egicoccus sp. AB-alg6-2 TaxID=3242692 RepID=UPI00359D0D39
MNLHVPEQLPSALPDYLPGRIHVVEPERWPTGAWVTNGVRVSVPRYGLEVFVRNADIDPERVRWHTRRTVHPLEASYVSLLHDRRLYVLKGHHVLAAHLAAGSDRIPVQLFRQAPVTVAPSDDEPGTLIDTGRPLLQVAAAPVPVGVAGN